MTSMVPALTEPFGAWNAAYERAACSQAWESERRDDTLHVPDDERAPAKHSAPPRRDDLVPRRRRFHAEPILGRPQLNLKRVVLKRCPCPPHGRGPGTCATPRCLPARGKRSQARRDNREIFSAFASRTSDARTRESRRGFSAETTTRARSPHQRARRRNRDLRRALTRSSHRVLRRERGVSARRR